MSGRARIVIQISPIGELHAPHPYDLNYKLSSTLDQTHSILSSFNTDHNPRKSKMAGLPKGAGRVPTGYAAETFISESTFREAHRAIESGNSVSKKRKREGKGDTSVVSGAGAYKGPWARYEEERPDAASDEEYGSDEEVEIVYEEDEIEANPAAASKKLAGTDYADTAAAGETSEFVGSQQHDYQGRTYMHIPNGMLNLTISISVILINLQTSISNSLATVATRRTLYPRNSSTRTNTTQSPSRSCASFLAAAICYYRHRQTPRSRYGTYTTSGSFCGRFLATPSL